MNLQPQITFKVKTVNYEELFKTIVPDENFNNILNNLKNQTVWIEGVDYPLKDGDEFTLYGKEAVKVYNLYINNPTEPNMLLEVVQESILGSLYFNGSSNIRLAGSDDWAVGTGDFTVEWFQYQENGGSYPRIFAVQPWPDTQIGVSVEEDGDNYYAWIGGEGYGTSISNYLNQWIHCAITRESGTLYIFKDGDLSFSTTSSEDITDNTNLLYIGSTSDGDYFTGHITNFHFVKGTALYTSNFTPPTSPITPVSNTKLLLLTSSEDTAFDDSSALNKSVTNNGALWSSLNPFSA